MDKPESFGNQKVFRIPASQVEAEFLRVLLKNGFTETKSKILARVYTENSIDGVYTHGINRFSKFILYVKEKVIDVNAEPELKHSAGALEQWNGNLGAGILNALKATDRAMELAAEFGIGCVALANTNHWMRGGTYGWRAAKKGFAFISWTNTLGLMPAWGAINPKIGNNPIVFGAPYNDEAMVLDMAMSQFAYGKLEAAQIRNQQMPMFGGYNKDGILTTDPTEILESQRLLPTGYWKGAGLALLIDILATVLSGGTPTYEISKQTYEHALSQVFIAMDLSKLGNASSISQTINQIIDDYHTSIPENESKEILYPGERVLKTRKDNLLNGIPVDEVVWKEIIRL
ncbi:MAG: 3-dehydro-L-gulonate 2-dehydrogenase [Stygiobacter sp.]|nr:MAG: 3-dehydro-L-gulonate 2-dehydrogenase [Stygiobacter sp.]KAF0217648.1 MAG: 3-dehydro-L-gulonate [Ignavibacteria bacterium]